MSRPFRQHFKVVKLDGPPTLHQWPTHVHTDAASIARCLEQQGQADGGGEQCDGEYPCQIQVSPTHFVSCYRYYEEGKEE